MAELQKLREDYLKLRQSVEQLQKQSAQLPLFLPATAPSWNPEQPPLPSEPAVVDQLRVPFAFGDFTWMNGANRQTSSVLDTKYVTGSVLFDGNYTYSFNHPIDHTIGGSTLVARHNEFQITVASIGGDFHYKNARATVTLQYGLYTTLVTRNDPSVNRGQGDLAAAFRYIREANAGYHWDKLYGINLDFGIFMSYIGLFSYVNFENWAYQPSYVSDNTPFFFNGIRLQVFPTERLKVEVWLINGWQSYAMFNEAPGIGYQINYRPREWLSLAFNGYVGFDTHSAAGRVRAHSDNSLLVRYFNAPGSRVLSKAAFSLTADYGFEHGNGVSAFGQGDCSQVTNAGCVPEQSFVAAMLYNRFWFYRDLAALTVGGGFIRNPGRYLVLTPPGHGADVFTANPGDPFNAWDLSVTVDYLPSQLVTFRLEYNHRVADTNYFVGPGGVTSPDGWSTTAIPTGTTWAPDLVKTDDHITFAMLFRM